jgi:peptidoglycan biosynthesis protein MviN/MurJ (putative lipid II flippase)
VALAMLADALFVVAALLRLYPHPALVALGSVVLNVALLFGLYQFGLTGIGLAYVLSRLLSLAMLLILLTRRLGSLGADYIMSGGRVMLGAAVSAGAAAYVTLWHVLPYVNQHTFVGIFVQGTAAGLVGVLYYFALTMYAKLPEVEFMERWLTSAWRLTRRLWNQV